MGWFGHEDEGQPIEIEVDHTEDGTEGRSALLGTATHGRIRSVVLVVVGVVIGVVATLTVGRDVGPGGTATATSAPSAAATTSASASPPRTLGRTVPTSIPSASTPATLPLLPLGHPTGIVLYLTPDGGAPDALIAYDVDRGQTHRMELGRDVGWYIRTLEAAGGVVLDGGVVVAVAQGRLSVLDDGSQGGFTDAPTGRIAPGPNGGLWVRRPHPPEIELLDATGATTGLVLDLPRGADLYGSMADGLPVVRSADGRVFVVGLDGHRTLLANNALGPVEAGRFGETRCDSHQSCTLIAHIDGQEIGLGNPRSYGGTVRQVRFQPGGPIVAIFGNDNNLSLVDTRSSGISSVVVDLDPSVLDEPPVRFLPNGAGLVAATRSGLQFVDLAGNRIVTVDRQATPIAGNSLLGVGTRTPWRSP